MMQPAIHRGTSFAGQRLAYNRVSVKQSTPRIVQIQCRSLEAGKALLKHHLSPRCCLQEDNAFIKIYLAFINIRNTPYSFLAGVGLFGTKAGMTMLFKDGLAYPATVIALEEGNIVTQVKTNDKDGYDAVQVGYQVVAERKLTKPEVGHTTKAGAPPLRHLREFKVKNVDGYEPGKQLQIEEMFKVGDLIDVAGTTIGKGFQGGIKRWGFARGNMTHGSKSKREHGSFGPGTTPGRIFPGVKQAGQMGNVRTKLRKVEVLMVDAEKKAIVVKGSVPGKPGNVVEMTPAKLVGINV